ncbi:MAG: SEL1-like repeat protein [Alphaproteobacteria bacterium]
MFLSTSAAEAFSSSLDDLYRKMLSENYEGSLPEFVINRQAPEFEVTKLDGKKESPDFLVKKPDAKIEAPKVDSKLIKAMEYGAPEPIKTWKDIVVSVQKGNPSPFDIAEITKKADEKDKNAVEILAWLNANGIGMKQDLHKAWELYSLAANLGVENAGKNANAVWRAMNDYQKQTLAPY